jgi:predicted XRE-type DNA-binding protein
MTPTTMPDVTQGTTNVYADLGYQDADEMLVKAQLATRIGEIIKRRRLTQLEAAEIVGLPRPKLSAMLRRQFSGISASKMLHCLTRLGRDYTPRFSRSSAQYASRRPISRSNPRSFGR